jgi:hypothetical protein
LARDGRILVAADRPSPAEGREAGGVDMDDRANQPTADEVVLFKAYSILELQERRQLAAKDPHSSFIDVKLEQKNEGTR